MSKKRNDISDIDFGIDSRYTSDKEQEFDAAALMEARLKRMKNLSSDKIRELKLVQLKLQMEDYIKKPVDDCTKSFSEFLEFYIDTLYTSRGARSEFAKDMDITPVSLSQIINKHRDPNDEFIMKLMIHSEKIYKKVYGFQMEIWYQVYFHEKLCETMSKQSQWRLKFEKQVRTNDSVRG